MLNDQINRVLMPRIIESEEVKITTSDKGHDIYDEYLDDIIDETSKAHFYNWTVKGLLTIGIEDGGSYHSSFGAGADNDYVYSKYTKSNVKQFETVSKTYEEYLDIRNTTSSVSNVDEKLKQFLELLRNKTGEIPEIPGDEGGFTGKNDDPSIVVKYDDIYDGTIPAGDLLLDNGAEMLFKLLEQHDNTQNLVNLFKYLAYLYTGTDYGVTDASQLEAFFTSLTTRTRCSNPTLEYIQSWENPAVKDYLNGTGSYEAASKYITRDKTQYIVYKEEYSDTWNFSYGLNITGGGYDDLFEKHGLNPPATYYHEGATANVEKLDKVCADKVAQDRQTIINITKGYNLTNYQVDALLAVRYQYGNIDGFRFTYTEDLKKFKNEFWVNTARGGKAYPFAEGDNRKAANWKLFSEGIYTDRNGRVIATSADGGDIISVAEQVHTYMEQNRYTYGHTDGGTPEGMRNQRVANCISFVTWVYYEAGYMEDIYINCGTFETAVTRGKYAGKFEKITSYEALQPGDIMIFDDYQHAEIYAGDGYSYNAGTTNAIRGHDPKYRGRNRGRTIILLWLEIKIIMEKEYES